MSLLAFATHEADVVGGVAAVLADTALAFTATSRAEVVGTVAAVAMVLGRTALAFGATLD